MKKLIAISVVFALVAGAAFAVDLGGTVIGTVDVAGASGGNDAELFNGGLGRIRLEGSGDAEIGIGTVGGWLRAEVGGGFDFNADGYGEDYAKWQAAGSDPAKEPEEYDYFGINTNFYGLAWWQPFDALKLQIGVNPDGHYDTSHIGRYGFYAQANEIGLVNSDGNWGGTSYDNAIFGGYGNLHFALIITPIEALSINVAIPLNEKGDPDNSQPSVTFKSALFQVNYAADFGAIHVTYAGGGIGNTIGTMYGSFYLGLIENLGLELGLGYTLKKADTGKDPLGVALGVSYNAGAFGAKLRTILQAGGETAAGDKTDLAVRVDVLPYFAVNDSVTIYGDLGIYVPGKEQFQWHLAPYVRIGAEWGPGFYAGFKLKGAKGADAVDWAIPIGVIVSF